MKTIGFTAFVLAAVFILLALFSSRTYPAQCQHQFETQGVSGYRLYGTDDYGLPLMYPDTVEFPITKDIVIGDTIKTFARCAICGKQVRVAAKKSRNAIWRDSVSAVIDSVRKGLKK